MGVKNGQKKNMVSRRDGKLAIRGNGVTDSDTGRQLLRGEHSDLDVFVESAENVVDLILEAARQHLIRLVQYKHLDVASA